MNGPPRNDAARGRGGPDRETKDQTSAVYADTTRPFAIVIHGAGKRTLWGRYPSWQAANESAMRLRAHSFDARIVDDREAAP